MVVPPKEWDQYKRVPGFVLGFHGCDRATGEAILAGKPAHLTPSANSYDWLGGGIYFWESDPWRALAFAQSCVEDKHLTKGTLKTPYVLGAVIDLGNCCNLFERDALDEVRKAHAHLELVYKIVHDAPLPKNRGFELGMRFLDKAVLDTVHSLRKGRGIPSYDSVRAPFVEGTRLYDGAGFKDKNHIQIAVLTPSAIKGYFRLPGF